MEPLMSRLLHNRIRSIAAAGACVGVLLLAVGCFRSEPEAGAEVDPGIVARVGGEPITEAELRAEWQRRRDRGQPTGGFEALAGDMARRRQQVRRALELGIDRDPEVVRQYENMLIASLREQELAAEEAGAEITEQLLRERYDQRIEQWTKPARVRLAVLVLRGSTGASQTRLAQIRARMEEARVRAMDLPADSRGFGALAVEYSEDQPTRYRGGDIGWVEVDRMDARFPAEVLEAGYTLPQNGAVSEVIAIQEGFFLVKRIDARAPQTIPFEEAEMALRRQLKSEQQQAKEREYQARLDQCLPVELYPERLVSLDALVESDAPSDHDSPIFFPQ